MKSVHIHRKTDKGGWLMGAKISSEDLAVICRIWSPMNT